MTREYQKNSRTLFQRTKASLLLLFISLREKERELNMRIFLTNHPFFFSFYSKQFFFPHVRPFFCLLLLALNTHNDYCRESFAQPKKAQRGWMDVLVRVVDIIFFPFPPLIGMRGIIHAGFLPLVSLRIAARKWIFIAVKMIYLIRPPKCI